MIAWESAGATHVGRVRKGNEDAFRIDQEHGIFLVADGMGGHAAGEVASQLAADSVVGFLLSTAGAFPPEEALPAAFKIAQDQIVDCCADDPRTQGMGTTLTVALLSQRGQLHIGHLGDSRVYRLQSGLLTQLTRDHTWVQQEVDAGRVAPDSARVHPLSHILTRVLTADEPSDPDVVAKTVSPGDTLLICSDGLHNLVDGQALLEIVAADLPPAETVERLIRTANRRGGTDNVTAVLVQIREA